MTISFCLPSNSSTKPNPINPSNPFEINPIQNDDASSSKQYITEFGSAPGGDPEARVIPPIPNSWRPGQISNLQSSVESLSIVEPELSLGLNLRPKPEPEDVEKFQVELERCPEHGGMDEFEDVPVEGYGAALLAGYGWRAGQGIGKNNANKDVPVREVQPMSGRHGLGFRPQQ